MSIDGTAGKVYAGQVKTAPSEIVAGLINGDEAAKKTEKFKNFQQLMKWCSDATRMSVRTNADTPEQTANAVAFGAVGIGLTPHRAHVLRGRPHRRDARDDPRRDARGAEGGARQAAAVPARRLRRHLPRAEGLPGDDPLPRSAAARVPAAHARSSRRSWRRRSACRRRASTSASSSCTSSTRCSASAAAVSASAIPRSRRCRRARCSRPRRIVQKEGIKVRPEIMIPLVGFKKELDLQIEVVHQAAREVQAEKKVKLNYMVGTMIEIPRGALTADEIAQSAEFFSFGTNDLTQTGLGMSRDDSGSFLPHYAGARDRQEEPVRDDRRDRRRPARRDRGDEGPRARGRISSSGSAASTAAIRRRSSSSRRSGSTT